MWVRLFYLRMSYIAHGWWLNLVADGHQAVQAHLRFSLARRFNKWVRRVPARIRMASQPVLMNWMLRFSKQLDMIGEKTCELERDTSKYINSSSLGDDSMHNVEPVIDITNDMVYVLMVARDTSKDIDLSSPGDDSMHNVELVIDITNDTMLEGMESIGAKIDMAQ
ncbi:hypothetical protein V6N11_071857 [Hibiscus sabdariffa]|uniref:Uncharacterized protein n=1 Tax=Hibiscus sabdariffa TaxID=183260 RepID=A0ABR2U216_9ROSI